MEGDKEKWGSLKLEWGGYGGLCLLAGSGPLQNNGNFLGQVTNSALWKLIAVDISNSILSIYSSSVRKQYFLSSFVY